MGKTKKATVPGDAKKLTDIPNVGPRIADDLRLLGYASPADLIRQDPYQLYVRLCQLTKSYHDPCVLDTFIAVTAFMAGHGAKDWWSFTAERKTNFHLVEDKVAAFRKTKSSR